MKKILIISISAIVLSGCATVTRGKTEALLIETTPAGATVTTSLENGCAPTPCAIAQISRKAEFAVTVSKEGYKTATYNITHETAKGGSIGMAGNLLAGGIIGVFVDAKTG